MEETTQKTCNMFSSPFLKPLLTHVFFIFSKPSKLFPPKAFLHFYFFNKPIIFSSSMSEVRTLVFTKASTKKGLHIFFYQSYKILLILWLVYYSKRKNIHAKQIQGNIQHVQTSLLIEMMEDTFRNSLREIYIYIYILKNRVRGVFP